MRFFDLQLALQNRDTATELSLSNRQYPEVPQEVFLLKKLKKLDLSQNQLKTIQPQIADLTDLVELDLSDNVLESLPDAMTGLYALQKLDMSSNRLNEVPDWISQLKSLTHLELASNSLRVLPAKLFNLHSLKLLNISYNQLEDIPPTIRQLKILNRLLLSNNRLAKLPPQLGALPLLNELDVSHNKLTRLPSELGRLPSLSLLRASNNLLDALPASLSNAAMLRQLDISYNRFEKFPHTALRAVWLSRINLEGNLLQKLPNKLTGLDRLDILNLTNNRLKTLPFSIGSLSMLRELYLSDNRLQQYKWPAKGYTVLERLYVEDNPSIPKPEQVLVLPALNNLASKNKLLNDWIHWFDLQNTPANWRLLIYQCVVENSNKALSKALKKPEEALNFNIPAFINMVRTSLFELPGPPLSKGAVVFPIGYISSDLSDLGRRLSQQGILLEWEKPDMATHFLLGMPPITLPPFKKGKQTFISERELAHWLDTREGLHLANISQESDHQVFESLIQLACSSHDANRQLVAEMLIQGGMPLSLLSQAFEYRAQHITYHTNDPLDALFQTYLPDADKLYWHYLKVWQEETPGDYPRQPVPGNAQINWNSLL